LAKVIIQDHKLNTAGLEEFECGLLSVCVEDLELDVLHASEMMREQDTLRFFVFDMEDLDCTVRHGSSFTY
jgi:hypothetical protein